MSDLPRRLRASLKFDAINGDRSERQVCGLQMAEAARTIDDLTTRLAAAEADAGRYRWLRDRGDDCQWQNLLRVEVDDFSSLDAAIDAARGGE